MTPEVELGRNPTASSQMMTFIPTSLCTTQPSNTKKRLAPHRILLSQPFSTHAMAGLAEPAGRAVQAPPWPWQ